MSETRDMDSAYSASVMTFSIMTRASWMGEPHMLPDRSMIRMWCPTSGERVGAGSVAALAI